MAKAVRVHGVGGPEVMAYEDVTVGDPGAGEVRLKQDFVGLNYIDTYHRTGAYPMHALYDWSGSRRYRGCGWRRR